MSFINTPVPSNTFLLIDEAKHCLVIDPGTKEQTDLREYIQSHGLTLDYIILTHEHFDHCWGVNFLLETFPAKVIATQLCAEWVETPMNYFNQLYYNSDEMYQIKKVDILVEEIGERIMWGDLPVLFIKTPGHTNKGMCIEIGKCLFTGDTLLYKTKPFIKKRYGGSILELKNSIETIYNLYSGDTKVFPGHGDPFLLRETKEFYYNYFNNKKDEMSN
ncbi:MAG: MBL fold metallo-hydrolase [Prevotella sp.]|nr:MBL fold metallo-hydrolase [Prevotella sp.]